MTLKNHLPLTTSPPKVIWEDLRHHTSRQKMVSPAACASCAMPTADESNSSILSESIQNIVFGKLIYGIWRKLPKNGFQYIVPSPKLASPAAISRRRFIRLGGAPKSPKWFGYTPSGLGATAKKTDFSFSNEY